jgi:segregation and condensation protein A
MNKRECSREPECLDLEVQMECFDPLSVLINLIKRNKVDIFDIPMSMITERFLSMLNG